MRSSQLGLCLACLATVGCGKTSSKPKEKEKEKEAPTSWQVSQFDVSLTVSPQGENFVVMPKEYSNDFQVFQCDAHPCLPSEQKNKQLANVSVDLYQGYGKFKVWIPEVPEEYKWSLGWKLKFDLDPSMDQRFYHATANGQDKTDDVKQNEGELVLEPSDGGQSVEVEVINLKSAQFSKCGWDADDCYEGKCCKSDGMTCYLKDDYWGMCRPTGSCTPGIDEADGQEWKCKDVGSKPEVEPFPPAPEDEAAGSSLFCFTVSTPLTYEAKLVKAQRDSGAGVFGCDQSAVYNGAKTDAKTKVMVIKDWTAIWQEVFDDGLWKKADWTIKAEVDTVFSASRVRARLVELSPYGGVSMYLKNSRDGIGLPMPFMMFSQSAVELLHKDKEDCKTKVERRKGESFFLSTCLDASGSGYMLDEGLIDDRRSSKDHKWDLADTSFCGGEGILAFRPFQQAKHWLDCSEKAEQAARSLLKDRL